MVDISIVIPFYKVPYEYMHECLRSVINQTYQNIEIILVDDGSPDDCGKICDEYKSMDDRIVVIHKKNGGLSDARNAGIEVASSEWITFVDGDDWIERDFCEHFMNRIKSCSNIADVYFYSGFRNFPNKEVIGMPHFEDGKRFSNHSEREFLQGKCCTIHLEKNGNRKGITISSAWAKMYKLAYIKRHNLRFPIVPYDEDSIFYMYALEKAESVEYVAKAIYHYRFTENSIVNKYRPNALQEQNLYLSELFKFVEIFRKSDSCRRLIYMRGMTSMLLMLKQYYYNDKNPATSWKRWKAFNDVIKEEPFKSVFKNIRISDLGRNAMIKYILLRLKMYGQVEYLRRKNSKV